MQPARMKYIHIHTNIAVVHHARITFVGGGSHLTRACYLIMIIIILLSVQQVLPRIGAGGRRRLAQLRPADIQHGRRGRAARRLAGHVRRRGEPRAAGTRFANHSSSNNKNNNNNNNNNKRNNNNTRRGGGGGGGGLDVRTAVVAVGWQR
jgi:hypothetical protein